MVTPVYEEEAEPDQYYSDYGAPPSPLHGSGGYPPPPTGPAQAPGPVPPPPSGPTGPDDFVHHQNHSTMNLNAYPPPPPPPVNYNPQDYVNFPPPPPGPPPGAAGGHPPHPYPPGPENVSHHRVNSDDSSVRSTPHHHDKHNYRDRDRDREIPPRSTLAGEQGAS